MVQQEFEALFPGEVEQVRLVKDTTTLDSLVGEYTKVKRQLEDLVDEYQGRRKRLLKVRRRTVRMRVFNHTYSPCWSTCTGSGMEWWGSRPVRCGLSVGCGIAHAQGHA